MRAARASLERSLEDVMTENERLSTKLDHVEEVFVTRGDGFGLELEYEKHDASAKINSVNDMEHLNSLDSMDAKLAYLVS